LLDFDGELTNTSKDEYFKMIGKLLTKEILSYQLSDKSWEMYKCV